jgi:predicted dehydrogenase
MIDWDYYLQWLFKAAYNRLTLRADYGSIGIGLVGVGGWGASNAVSIMRSKRFNILGVYDVRGQASRWFANRYNTMSYSQLDELLNNSDIQAIIVTVPNHFHADMVKEIANAGKHIFVEKPLASDPGMCRELGQYCHERDVILQVGHQMRKEPVFRKIKHLLENDGFWGCPLYAQAVYTLERQSRDDWRQDADLCPGGSMEQLGVHVIDVLIYLFGLPEYVRGWSENISQCSADVPDWAHVSLSFSHNLRTSVSTSFSTPRYMRLEIFLDDGRLATDGHVLWISRDGRTVERKPKGLDGSVVQFVEFADCIEYGQRPETDANVAASVMEVVQSVYIEEEI